MEWENRVTENLICVDTDDTQSIIFPEVQELSQGYELTGVKFFFQKSFIRGWNNWRDVRRVQEKEQTSMMVREDGPASPSAAAKQSLVPQYLVMGMQTHHNTQRALTRKPTRKPLKIST